MTNLIDYMKKFKSNCILFVFIKQYNSVKNFLVQNNFVENVNFTNGLNFLYNSYRENFDTHFIVQKI